MDTKPDTERGASSRWELERRILARSATVGVVGLGYVGLPLLVEVARAGFPVVGLDVDERRMDSLEQGRSYIADVSQRDLQQLDNIRLATNADALRQADVIILSVPTPLKDGTPDLTFVMKAASDVAGILRSGQLVILESTTYPGTTEEIVAPVLESSGLSAGHDFFLGYSPERIDPGRSRPFAETPKVVSGIGQADKELVTIFYSQIVDEVVGTPTPREAEMAKLIENTFRQVNIALVNELAMLAPDLNVDIWAAIEAAATKPFGFMPFWPGPGVGGHCIAIDPTYLSWRVDQRLGFGIKFVEHARAVNNHMPSYIVHRIAEALNQMSKPLKGSRIMALGVAYKADVDDVRESPALAVLEGLSRAGAICSYHDPHIPHISLLGEQRASQPLDPEFLETQDCVAILTAHHGIDYGKVASASRLVFDSRGVTRTLSDRGNVILL
jgi:UDP-N-acetyl-D-glucosamine dehydrogenase